MITVYFDRNVFADICNPKRRGLTEEDTAKIQRAVDSGSVMIPASFTVIEETISILRDSEEKYRQNIQTVLDLIDKDKMIRPHYDLLRDDCLSYALGQPISNRFLEPPAPFKELLDPSKNPDLKKVADEIKAFYMKGAAEIQSGIEKAIELGGLKGFGKASSYEEVWDGSKLTCVEVVLKPLPRNARRLCKKRGLEGMLNINSVRLFAIYYTWVVYSYWLKGDGTPGRMKPSDGGDWFHAVCASAADVFVTQESKTKLGKLPYILSLVPTPGLEVISLQEFLQRI